MSMARQRAAAGAPTSSPVHRLALVTGANRGLGFEVARQLAARGCSMLLGTRDLAKGRQAARQIGGDAVAVPLDVTDAVQIAELATWIKREHGRLDVLVNNAGGHADREARTGSTTPGSVRAALETNLLGAWQLCCR